jgi:hypothetical protein
LPAPGYDQLAERRFEFIPLLVVSRLPSVHHAARRLSPLRHCGCGRSSLGDGKRTLTKPYMLFLADWARRLSWKETAEAFRTSWDKVFDAVEHVLTFGLEHRVLGQIDAIGVDEIQYPKGHKYLTLVHQIDLDVTRLLWVGRERTIESFRGFFTVIGDELAWKIVFVCSDTDLSGSNYQRIRHIAASNGNQPTAPVAEPVPPAEPESTAEPVALS